MILSRQTQAALVAAALDHNPIAADPDDLDPPFAEFYNWVTADPPATWQEFIREFSIRSQDDRIAVDDILHVRDQVALPPVDQVFDALPNLAWLWPAWIPRGQITLLAGDPSSGKSYLTLDIARRIVAGQPMPDGVPPAHAGPILYVDAENRPMVLKGRLGPWTLQERQQFYYMLPDDRRMMINFDDGEEMDRFLTNVYQVRPALIIIDSYSTITLRGENSKEDVQRILAFLTRVARDYDCAILVIHHLRKKLQMQLTLPGLAAPLNLANVRGSGHIAAMATNAIGMSIPGTDLNGPRTLQVIKNNLGKIPPPLGVVFEPWSDDPEIAILHYGDPPALDQTTFKIDACLAWLLDLLAGGGEMSPDEIIELARYEDFSQATIYRARKKAGDQIKNTSGFRDPRTMWTLSQVPPPSGGSSGV